MIGLSLASVIGWYLFLLVELGPPALPKTAQRCEVQKGLQSV